MSIVDGHLNGEVTVSLTANIRVADPKDKTLFKIALPGAQEFFGEVLIERARQVLLWGEQNERTLHEWCGILGEEKGEVDRACNEIVFGGEPEAVENLQIELVQVAATCMAFAQAVRNGLSAAEQPEPELPPPILPVMSKPIILLCGPVGSGKDSVAKHVIEKYGFVKGSFARPLKKLCAEQFGWDLAQLDDLEYKETFDPALNATRRQILQRVGTEWFRSIDPQHWTKKAVESIRADLERPEISGIVVSDLRFVNEAAVVRASFPGLLVLVIKVVREDGHAATSGAGHSSELEWAQIQANAEISAPFGQLPLLYQRADAVVDLVLDIAPRAR